MEVDLTETRTSHRSAFYSGQNIPENDNVSNDFQLPIQSCISMSVHSNLSHNSRVWTAVHFNGELGGPYWAAAVWPSMGTQKMKRPVMSMRQSLEEVIANRVPSKRIQAVGNTSLEAASLRPSVPMKYSRPSAVCRCAPLIPDCLWKTSQCESHCRLLERQPESTWMASGIVREQNARIAGARATPALCRFCV